MRPLPVTGENSVVACRLNESADTTSDRRTHTYARTLTRTGVDGLVHDSGLDHVGGRAERGRHQPGGEGGAGVRDGVVPEAPVLAEEALHAWMQARTLLV